MTMAMCSPDTESRCARPESRIAAMSAAGMALCPPVSSATETAPAPAGIAAATRASMPPRSPASCGGPASPGVTSAGPSAKPLPPSPENHAARWKSHAPG